MNRRNPFSPAGSPTVTVLLVAVAGIVVQIVSRVDFPTVPPGIVIPLVAAGMVASGPLWRAAAGVVVGRSFSLGSSRRPGWHPGGPESIRPVRRRVGTLVLAPIAGIISADSPPSRTTGPGREKIFLAARGAASLDFSPPPLTMARNGGVAL